MGLKRLAIVAALLFAGCYHAPGSGPAPSGNDLTAAAAGAFPAVAKEYARIDREAIDKLGEWQDVSQMLDWLKAHRHDALENGEWRKPWVDAFNARISKKADGRFDWKPDEVKKILEDEARGLSGE